MKVGILHPRSDMYPKLAMDFMNGLKLGLQRSIPDTDFEFVIEGIGNASEDPVIKAAEKMLLQEEVALTISFCGNSILDELVKLFHGYKKPLIHADLGGNLLKTIMVSDYVLHYNLNLVQSAYASGIYAAKNYGKKVAMLSSFYDGGYQMAAGFDLGFTEGGGQIVYQHVSPMDYKQQNLEEVFEQTEAAEPEIVYCLYSYNEGNVFLEKLAKSALNGKVPIMTTAIMTDESFVKENYGLKNMMSIGSWSFDDKEIAMQEFVGAYKNRYGEKPNPFGLLAYEIALVIAHSIDKEGKIPSEIGKFWKEKTLKTPRGEVSFNNHYESQATFFKLRQFEYNQIAYHNHVVEKIENNKSQTLNQHFEEQQLSGWKNPYICT